MSLSWPQLPLSKLPGSSYVHLALMKKLFEHWWQACIAGILVGLPIGIALEFARRWRNVRISKQIADQFESNGMSPPLMIDNLQPWFVPILIVIFFVLLALLIYAVMNRRGRGHLKS